jgi:hypothetical protein
VKLLKHGHFSLNLRKIKKFKSKAIKMSEENEIDMNWNGDKDLAMMISYIK